MSDHVCEMCGSAWSGSLPPGKIYLCERCRPEAPDVDPAVFEREKAKLQKALRDMERSTMSDHDYKGHTSVPGVDTESIPLTRTVSVDTYRIAIGEVQRLRSLYLEALAEIEAWKSASGLQDGSGDPDGVTPDADDFMAEGNDMLRAMEAEAAAADSRIAELERRIELFAGSFRDESKLRHALEARHRKLREAMSRLVDELEGFSLKGHYGKCSPPMTDCDGDCANDAWLQEVLAKARRALAEDKEAQDGDK